MWLPQHLVVVGVDFVNLYAAFGARSPAQQWIVDVKVQLLGALEQHNWGAEPQRREIFRPVSIDPWLQRLCCCRPVARVPERESAMTFGWRA